MKQRILISRTDSIGDVMLTLPMCFYIKSTFPEATVLFLGKSYTKDIIEKCPYVDQFINSDDFQTASKAEIVAFIAGLKVDTVVFALPDKRWMELFYAAKVPKRIATGHRLQSWKWATDRPMFGRKNSDLHEAQLNIKLLRPLGVQVQPTLQELGNISLFQKSTTVPQNRLIIHPFSQGSALNWSLQQYDELVGLLMDEGFEIVISGTAKDAEQLASWTGENLKKVTSICGQFSLASFIEYIGQSKALLACSTGPLHLAAAQGIHAVGLYVDRRPIHPGRWRPIGPHVHVVKENDVDQKKILTTPTLVATFLKSIMERPATKH
jgi:heptosyltransferase-3